MFVYLQGEKQQVGRHTLYVQPASTEKENADADWFDPEGKPLLMELFFQDGRLEVAENLGRLLVSKKLVGTKPPSGLIVPTRRLQRAR